MKEEEDEKEEEKKSRNKARKLGGIKRQFKCREILLYLHA
jgi:hypothetical protein